MRRRIKIAFEIDAKLYESMLSVAKKHGVSEQYVVEQALEKYLHGVPSQDLVRSEVMDAFQRSVKRNARLLKRLAR